jgi:uracil-DNA glycosylase
VSTEGLAILAAARKECTVCIRRDPGQIFNGSQEPFDPDVVSYWSQWLGHPKPKLLVVGQDFGDIGYFIRHKGCDAPKNDTNVNLRALLSEAGLLVGAAPRYDPGSRVFLTNSVLCLKGGAMSTPIKERWVKSCAQRHLSPLLELLRAPIVVAMGRHGWSAVRQVLELSLAPERIAEAAGKHWTATSGQEVFAVGHCSGLGLANRSWSTQVTDWKAIRPYLERSNMEES